MSTYVERVFEVCRKKNPGEVEFRRTVEEVLTSLAPVMDAHPEYEEAGLLERLVEPERGITFRVVWVDDSGKVQVNKGYRYEFNSAIGPYKGGLEIRTERISWNHQVLRFRTNLQELPDRTSYRRRQGRCRLRSERQKPMLKS